MTPAFDCDFDLKEQKVLCLFKISICLLRALKISVVHLLVSICQLQSENKLTAQV